MLEEIIVDELSGEHVETTFHTGERDPKLICIDSGANIFILTWLLACAFDYVAAGNRFIRTAAAGGRLKIEALFSAGHVAGIRLCGDAAASLMPTNVIVECFCAVLFDRGNNGGLRCRIVADESSYGCESANYFIDCLRINNLWWITEQVMLDIICSRGFPLAEAQRLESSRVADQSGCRCGAQSRAFYGSTCWRRLAHGDDLDGIGPEAL